MQWWFIINIDSFEWFVSIMSQVTPHGNLAMCICGSARRDVGSVSQCPQITLVWKISHGPFHFIPHQYTFFSPSHMLWARSQWTHLTGQQISMNDLKNKRIASIPRWWQRQWWEARHQQQRGCARWHHASCTFWCPTDSVWNPVILADSGGMALESVGMGPESAGMRLELLESTGMRPEWLNSAGMPPEFIMREGLRQYQNHLIGHIWYKRHIYYIYYYL